MNLICRLLVYWCADYENPNMEIANAQSQSLVSEVGSLLLAVNLKSRKAGAGIYGSASLSLKLNPYNGNGNKPNRYRR